MVSVYQEAHIRIFFESCFLPVHIVAKQYILLQKCLNGQIGTCLLGTRNTPV